MFNLKKGAVALDIGSSYIKMLELSESMGSYKVVNFGYCSLPREAIVDGALINSTVIEEAVREIVTRYKIKTKNVVTSVSGHSVIIKKITVPQMSPEELNDSLQWEAEQYIPFNIEEVNIDAHILSAPKDGAGQMDVLLVAAKKDMVNDYVQIITNAGLNPAVIDVDAFAVQNMFELNYGLRTTETVALVNIGASIININVLRGGLTSFTRDISQGGDQFTEEIQKQLNIPYEQAEKLKIGGELMGDKQSLVPQEVEDIVLSASEGVATEVQRSLDFYSATSTEDHISRIYISGGSARVPGLTKIIEQRTGIPVEIVNPFKNIEFSERVLKAEYVKQIAPMAAVAVGLALRRPGDHQ